MSLGSDFMLKACAFDLGNTLVNDTKIFHETITATENWLHQNDFLPKNCSFVRNYMKVNRETNIPFISHTFGELVFFEKTFRKLKIVSITPEQGLLQFRRIMLQKMKLEPGIKDALAFLHDQGLKTALLTNESKPRVQAFLDKTTSRDLFDEVVVSHEVGYEKPDPRFFKEALQRLEIEPSELAMFGDNEIADGACKKLGILFVLVTAMKKKGWCWKHGKAYSPDYLIGRIDPESIARFLIFAAADKGATDKNGVIL